jgi:hypothetical protein
VVAELHRDAEALEHADRLAAKVVRDAVRRVIEVAAVIDRPRLTAGLGLLAQQEELDLRMCVEGEPQPGCLCQCPLEHMTRIGVRRGAVR